MKKGKISISFENIWANENCRLLGYFMLVTVPLPLFKMSQSFASRGKPTALWVAFTDCANWTECVTWFIVGVEGVSTTVSRKGGAGGEIWQLEKVNLLELCSLKFVVYCDKIWVCSSLQLKETLHLEHSVVWCRILGTSECYQMYQECFYLWTGQRWNDCARDKWLHRANEDRKMVQTIKRRKADWIGYIWCRNCLLKHCIRGKIKGRVDEEAEVSRSSMTSRKRKEIGRSPWRPHFGRGYVPVVRQSTW